MRDERCAVVFVGGSGALCAGATEAVADVVAFMTRVFGEKDLSNSQGCKTQMADRKRYKFPMPIAVTSKASSCDGLLASTATFYQLQNQLLTSSNIRSWLTLRAI